MAIYTHTTSKYVNANRRRGGTFKRALKRLRTRIRDASKFKTAERVYGQEFPAFGGSLGAIYFGTDLSAPKKTLVKVPRNAAAGKPASNLKD